MLVAELSSDETGCAFVGHGTKFLDSIGENMFNKK